MSSDANSAPSADGPRGWLITGISGGLGRLMAEQLLERGDKVAGTVRQLASVADLQARYGQQLHVGRLDVTDIPAIKPVVDDAFAALGAIDVVINNAGYGMFGAAEEFTDAQIEHQIATNLTGSITVARAALPHLRAQGRGHIIQVSTFGGQFATPGGSMYNATKFGIEGFMEALAQEVAPFNIAVTIVEPGGTATNFRASAVLADPLAAYDDTPAAMVRGLRDGTRPSPGDPGKVAAMTLGVADGDSAPLRVVLGSDSYKFVLQGLTARLQSIAGQERTARLADVTPDAD